MHKALIALSLAGGLAIGGQASLASADGPALLEFSAPYSLEGTHYGPSIYVSEPAVQLTVAIAGPVAGPVGPLFPQPPPIVPPNPVLTFGDGGGDNPDLDQ